MSWPDEVGGERVLGPKLRKLSVTHRTSGSARFREWVGFTRQPSVYLTPFDVGWPYEGEEWWHGPAVTDGSGEYGLSYTAGMFWTW